jgi:hypothetical protein
VSNANWYKTLKGLRKAIAEKRVKGVLTIDSDATYFKAVNPKKPDDADEDVYIFDGGYPIELLRECLSLLGIPWEDV